jgi:hypothetical protein
MPFERIDDPVKHKNTRSSIIAERLPDCTEETLSILQRDSNQESFEKLLEIKKDRENIKVCIEELKKEICIHVYDRLDPEEEIAFQEAEQLLLSTEDEPFSYQVSEDTMVKMKFLCSCTDYTETLLDVDNMLDYE